MRGSNGRRIVAGVLLFALSGALTRTAHATLVGTSVTGAGYDVSSTAGVFLTTNFFDPANGLVPSGYGNSASTTVTISDSVIEFAEVYGGGTAADPGIDSITADFTDSGLTVTEHDNYSGGLTGFQLVFTDTAFSGLTLAKTSDGFANGGFTSSLVGDTLTLTVGPDCVLGTGCAWATTSSASWTLTPVPLPAAAWLLASGLGGLFGWTRTRNVRREPHS